MKIKITAAALAACLFMAGCSGAASVNTSKNSEPVDITIWHYYNGSQKAAFDDLVNEFNDTVGKEKGIYVEGHSKGNVSELENAVLSDVYKRQVWISYLDWNKWPKDYNGFTQAVDLAMDTCAANGMNAVFVQVRPDGDAMYPSRYCLSLIHISFL